MDRETMDLVRVFWRNLVDDKLTWVAFAATVVLVVLAFVFFGDVAGGVFTFIVLACLLPMIDPVRTAWMKAVSSVTEDESAEAVTAEDGGTVGTDERGDDEFDDTPTIISRVYAAEDEESDESVDENADVEPEVSAEAFAAESPAVSVFDDIPEIPTDREEFPSPPGELPVGEEVEDVVEGVPAVDVPPPPEKFSFAEDVADETVVGDVPSPPEGSPTDKDSAA